MGTARTSDGHRLDHLYDRVALMRKDVIWIPDKKA